MNAVYHGICFNLSAINSASGGKRNRYLQVSATTQYMLSPTCPYFYLIGFASNRWEVQCVCLLKLFLFRALVELSIIVPSERRETLWSSECETECMTALTSETVRSPEQYGRAWLISLRLVIMSVKNTMQGVWYNLAKAGWMTTAPLASNNHWKSGVL